MSVKSNNITKLITYKFILVNKQCSEVHLMIIIFLQTDLFKLQFSF